MMRIQMGLLSLCIFIGIALASCGTSEGVEDGANTNAPRTHYTFYQELPDGGRVLCVWAKSGYGGGLSCDWAGAS